METVKPNIKLARKLEFYAIIFSSLVLILVIAMRYISLEVPFDVMVLPPFHAVINSLTALCLLFSFTAIKFSRVNFHRWLNVLALGLSAIFSCLMWFTTFPPNLQCMEGRAVLVFFTTFCWGHMFF